MTAALAELLTRLGSRIESAERVGHATKSLRIGWPELDDALPDAGLPYGVVELAAPGALGGSASIALAAIRAAHAKDPRAWCAWIDTDVTLHAPGVAAAGVDLARLLVVRPPRSELARVAVKVAASRAFDVIAIDVDAVAGASGETAPTKRRGMQPEVLVRKLALLAEEGGAVVLLLTDSRRARAQPWPVALRLELARTRDSIALRVAKDRQGKHGSDGLAKTVPLRSKPCARRAG